MRELRSSVSPKGQVTLPIEIRRLLGVKPRDKVAFRVVDDEVIVSPIRSPLDESYQAIPALRPARSWEEIEAAVAGERASEAAREALDD